MKHFILPILFCLLTIYLHKTRADVTCGSHTAPTCGRCPEVNCPSGSCGSGWCNGDCIWKNSNCVLSEKIANRADQGGRCPRKLWSYAESCCCKDGCCWDKCVVYDLPPEICVTGTPGIKWVYNTDLGYHQALTSRGQLELSRTEHREHQLKTHNLLRKKHNVGPLKLDRLLNANAQSYAEHLARGCRDLVHSKGKWEYLEGYGENLWKGSYSASGVDASLSFHRNEEPNYNYATGRPWSSNPDGVIGHFTQLVWKGTTKLGVGIAGNKSKNCRFVVFQYQPQGNVQGIYTENVFKP